MGFDATCELSGDQQPCINCHEEPASSPDPKCVFCESINRLTVLVYQAVDSHAAGLFTTINDHCNYEKLKVSTGNLTMPANPTKKG
jgi:hypothetical protein